MADKPVTREEKYLAYLTGDYTGELPKPITRKEKYLYELCLKGIGGEISPEEIKNAVNEYLEKNPVKPGATTEQAQQIEQNKTDIASLKEETSSLKEDISNIISPNLFNPAVSKENVAISSGDGSEMNGFSGWETTDYIPVSKGEVLYFSSNNEPTTYATGAFYDNNKNRVDSFGNPNDNDNIAVTSDGYARFSFDSKKEKLQIEKGSRTTYVPYGELKVKAEVDNIKEDVTNIKVDVTKIRTEVTKIQEDHTNLFNKDTVTKGAVLTENGYFDSNFSGWDSSDYIPVKPGMVLYFSSNELPIGAASTGAYFDKNKEYLSGINNEPTVLTVPDGAYYLRFSKNEGLGDTLNTLKIEQHGITKFTPYGELYVTVNESALPSSILPKWKGLRILTLGDSITAMGGVNGWTYWIKQYLLADKVVNVSVAGSTWQDKVANQVYDGNPQPSTNGNVMGNQVQKVLNAKANGDADYQDFDVITFSFGTNDSVDFSVQTKESVENQFITNYTQNNFTVVPIDNVNRQTLAGAIRYGFQKLHEAYPNAVIFMCTPTQECYETFDSIYQKGDFINFVADRCGAETIDTRRCGIRNIYESQTTIDYDHPDQSGVAPIQTDLLDGIHTNESGAKKIAKYNAREIMKYFMIS
jgi:lysophospholipase L1-like esterase